MDPERSFSLRGLLVRASGAVLGVLALYVFGAGPTTYYQTRCANTMGEHGSFAIYGVLQRTYAPLEAVVQGDLRMPLLKYRAWWQQQAEKRYPQPYIWYY
jgi:hypothetical protein